MSSSRPTVSISLVATVIESAPDRVRRRLDRSPEEATRWNWQPQSEGWQVDTGGEKVQFAANEITSLDQVRCSCLLSPNCFHVMACLTVLETLAEGVSPAAQEAAEPAESNAADASETLAPSLKQREAAEALARGLANVLRVGVANAGVSLQAGLQRGVHACRAVGLHRAAALGIRVITGITQVRTRSSQADPPQLVADLADLLETLQHVAHDSTTPSFWIGTSRREQFPVRPRRLHGLLAEPVVTRSGHAGAIAWFLGEDGQFYSASDVRPGEVQLARDAYRGGIEIGPLIQPGRQLARGLYVGSELTASRDGRLGKGKKVKLAQQGESSWKAEIVAKRFAQPLPDQWQAVYRQATLPEDARPAGWDFTFFRGTVLGALGAELVLQLADGMRLRLGVANEDGELAFRANLALLSHAPGLSIEGVGRVSLADPTLVYPLAIANRVAAAEQPASDEPEPRLELPEAFTGRVMLGFDSLQRKHLRHAQAGAIVLGSASAEPANDALAPLTRRALAAALAGLSAHRLANVHSIAAETAQLQRSGFPTAASLLHTLTHGQTHREANVAETFLAVQLYLRGCRYELARARAAFDG